MKTTLLLCFSVFLGGCESYSEKLDFISRQLHDVAAGETELLQKIEELDAEVSELQSKVDNIECSG